MSIRKRSSISRNGLSPLKNLPGVDEVFAPGEFEERSREQRMKEGIPIEEKTWIGWLKQLSPMAFQHQQYSGKNEPHMGEPRGSLKFS